MDARQERLAEKQLSIPARSAIGVGLTALCGLGLALDCVWPAGFVYAAAGMAGVGVAQAELGRMLRRMGLPVHVPTLVVLGVSLFTLQWAGWAAPRAFPSPWVSASLVLAVAVTATLAGRVLSGRVDGAAQELGAMAASVLYVPLLSGFLTGVRAGWGVAGLISVLAVCKGGSTGAYFVGMAVGRRKLAPTVSPRKTWEGVAGAFAGSIAVAWALSRTPWALMSPGLSIGYGAVVAVAAVFGDLAGSLLKRQAGVKDSGNILPGLGGVLDMVDDVLFAAPASYVYLTALARLGLGG